MKKVKETPLNTPEKFRQATLHDVQTAQHGDEFYSLEGDKWRANGKPKLWKRSPDRVELPVKFGLYDYGYIREGDIRAGIVFIRIDW